MRRGADYPGPVDAVVVADLVRAAGPVGGTDRRAPPDGGAAMNGTATSVFAADWAPSSWQQRKALQQPQYEDATELAQATAQLAGLPPLVTSWEVLALKQALAEAQEGRRFLLQGGDCAESFADCSSPII